jgi:GNAT superfamily N-acetyltransferase
MNLQLKRFQREHYSEYASWFGDPELNRCLGPMDTDWLNAVLSEPEAAGVTWAVFRGPECVAVVETVFDPQKRLPVAITALATRPALRRQGIGTAVLELILSRHERQGITEHVAYIWRDNPSGQRCAEKAGFVPVTSEANERGYIEFRHSQQAVHLG